ncbi:MAG: hypothetical protein ACP5E3_01425, partial [Bacteroidales bacterium]
LNNFENRTMEEAVLFNYWPSEAIFGAGLIKEGMNYLKQKYEHMVNDEIGTLWEYSNLYVQNVGKRSSEAKDEWIGRSWSTAQAENAFPGIILSSYVLGIQAAAPGFTEAIIVTFNSPYESLKGKVPTPHGAIEVAKEKKMLSISIPDNVTGRIRLGSIEGFSTIMINNENYQINDLKKDLIIPSGNHIIKFE